MQTPIFDFVQQYQESHIARFHMPGHKGQPVLGCEGADITEIAGADNLQHPEQGGIIAQSEANATVLFGTAQTYYSAGGSSACISAMLYLAKIAAPAACKGRILAGRNAHKVFIQACALLDIQPSWLTPAPEDAQGLCGCVITPRALAQTLAAQQALPMAVYITSPDYLGNLADVAGLAEICAQYKLPLLVDNAHGAYLKYLQPSQHPIDAGAALCCDSAHKTLPVLTGGAYLHLAKGWHFADAKAAISLFSSTSPSYLILQSLDLCNAYLAGEYPAALAACVAQLNASKARLRQQGYTIAESEPLKLVVDCRKTIFMPRGEARGVPIAVAPAIAKEDGAAPEAIAGGEALATYLRGQGIEVEFADPDFLVCMCTPKNTAAEFALLEAALCALMVQPNPYQSKATASQLPCARAVCYALREALFSTGEEILVENAVGRICRLASVSCPPAIPIVVSGEVITKEDVNLFRYYGIETVNVIKEE